MPFKLLLKRSWVPLGRLLGALGLVLVSQGGPQGCPGRFKNRLKIGLGALLGRSWAFPWLPDPPETLFEVIFATFGSDFCYFLGRIS